MGSGFRIGITVCALTAALAAWTVPSRASDEPEPLRPAPQEWLQPYATSALTRKSFDELRERLFRDRDEQRVIAGMSWLVHARDVGVRRALGRGLAGAYLLGAQLGDTFEEDLLPALRVLVRDRDPVARYTVISALGMNDTPFLREVLIDHARGRIEVPVGPTWGVVRQKTETLLRALTDPDELEELVDGDDEALVRAWIAAAPERPAMGIDGRFQVLDVRRGRPREFELPSAREDARVSGCVVALVRADVVRATEPPQAPRSSDMLSISTKPVVDGAVSKGPGGVFVKGAGLYMNGITGFGPDTYFTTLVRYLGGDTVRVWVRVIPGYAERHPRR